MSKPILCLDFDGVLHNYTSGWKGAKIIPDGPVEGAAEFLRDAVEEFEVHILSSRSHQEGGIESMRIWLQLVLTEILGEDVGLKVLGEIQTPTFKPPALVTIDDRAIQFTGEWPKIEDLKNFKPWSDKREAIDERS